MATEAQTSNRRRKRPEPSPTAHDPIEIAMEAEKGDRSPDSPARRLLVDQRRLIGWEIADKRASLALKLLTALAGLVVAGILGVMAWTASQDESVVVQTFASPPAYAAKGLSGEVIAAKFMDQFRSVQNVTGRSYITNGRVLTDQEAVRIEIPQAGVSIGELQRLLAGWLGHRKVVSGELVETGPGQVSVSVRAANNPAFVQSGTIENLDGILRALAEHAYGEVGQGQLPLYLGASGRREEALAAAKQAALGAPPGTDPKILNRYYTLWGNSEDDPDLRLRLYAHAMAANPRGLATIRQMILLHSNLGHEQAAFDLADRGRSFRAGEQPKDFARFASATLHEEMIGETARLTGDHAGAAARFMRNERPNTSIPTELALAHEVKRARAWLADDLLSQRATLISAPLDRFYIAQATDDGPAMLAAILEYRAARDANPIPTPARAKYIFERIYLPLLALAQSAAGDAAGAQASVAATPLDCAPCLRARAVAAAAAGDVAGADHWCAAALAAAPRLPGAETLWGRLLLERGQPDAAIARLSAAVAKGPRSPDPLELWGEALLAKGDAKGAVRRFKAAEAFAPNWGRLHLKWGQALAKLGKAEQAREQFKLAAGLDLSAVERAELAKTPR